MIRFVLRLNEFESGVLLLMFLLVSSSVYIYNR